jgi:hypothetical protein
MKCWSVGQIPIKKCNVQKAPQAAATRAQVLQRTKELGLDFLDQAGALWMFCPAGKVFDVGDARHHSLFHEYGKKRSKFMWKALEKAHPQFQPEFVSSSRTQAYANLLQMLEDNPPIDCTERECEFCRFRQQLPLTAVSLLKLGEFCVQYELQ